MPAVRRRSCACQERAQHLGDAADRPGSAGHRWEQPPRSRPDYLVADKGYSSRANRALLRRRGIAHTIAQPADQAANRHRKGSARGRPVGFDQARYACHNVVECGFRRVREWRGLATRYDKHARNYAGALNLAALLTWLPRSARHSLAG
ncbi:transposase [Geodermatophilus nigrescens]